MKIWQFAWLMGAIYSAPHTSSWVTIATIAICALVTLICLYFDK